jgi:predicted  nucleic acid-binding Zn-ribbon protein
LNLECGELDNLDKQYQQSSDSLSKSQAQIKDNLGKVEFARAGLSKKWGDLQSFCKRAESLRSARVKNCFDKDADLAPLRRPRPNERICKPADREEEDSFKTCESLKNQSDDIKDKIAKIDKGIEADKVRLKSLERDISAYDHLQTLIADVKLSKHCPRK